MTFSRFYYGSTVWPVEVYRSLALARAALEAAGVGNPARHVLLVRTRGAGEAGVQEGIATILVSPQPFPTADLDRADQACAEIHCDVAYSWRTSADPNFDLLLTSREPEQAWRRFPLDVSPPVDDRPYFFFHARVGDILRGRDALAWGGSSFNLPAVRMLVTLTALVLGLAALLVVVPLFWMRRAGGWASSADAASPALYFAVIGLAFLFVEIGLIQRLSLFLGHPTFGFTVVLAGLLLGSGLGSLASAAAERAVGPTRRGWLLAAAPIAVAAAEAASRLALEHASGWTTPLRVALAAAILAPPAFLMGFAFPLGMAAVRRRGDPRGAWYWSINGALSVVASVLAMLASLAWGIRATLWVGVALYALAALLLSRLDENPAGRVADPAG